MKHELKIGKEYLQHLLDGTKKHEVRLNDRDYQMGDILEFDKNYPLHGCGWYKTVFPALFRITHIHSGLGLQQNYVVLSLEPLPESEDT